jgi:hypothetical protein
LHLSEVLFFIDNGSFIYLLILICIYEINYRHFSMKFLHL